MKTQLTELARESDGDSRGALLLALADMFMAADQSDMGTAKDLFGDVVLQLLGDVNTPERAGLSQRLANSELAPHELIMQLASDTAEVADPVLSKSPVLSLTDLVRLAGTQTVDHLMSIADRQHIDASVTDVLVQRGNSEVARKVTSNHTASFSIDTLNLLVARARKDESLQECLVQRTDLPKEVANALFPFLSKSLREKLAETGSGDSLHPVASTTSTGVDLHDMQAEIDKKIANILNGGNMESVICELAEQEDMPNIIYVVAHLAELPIDMVERTLKRKEPMPSIILCKSIDMPVDAFTAICRIRGARLGVSVPAQQSTIRQYQTVPVEQARKTISSKNSL